LTFVDAVLAAAVDNPDRIDVKPIMSALGLPKFGTARAAPLWQAARDQLSAEGRIVLKALTKRHGGGPGIYAVATGKSAAGVVVRGGLKALRAVNRANERARTALALEPEGEVKRMLARRVERQEQLRAAFVLTQLIPIKVSKK
jgi:hypothetical protein